VPQVWLFGKIMKAWQILERDGWCQGEAVNKNGAVCLVMAIIQSDCVSFEHARSAILERVNHQGGLVTWSDAKGRTADEVIGVLKELDI
jgi:hypothetical protein